MRLTPMVLAVDSNCGNLGNLGGLANNLSRYSYLRQLGPEGDGSRRFVYSGAVSSKEIDMAGGSCSAGKLLARVGLLLATGTVTTVLPSATQGQTPPGRVTLSEADSVIGTGNNVSPLAVSVPASRLRSGLLSTLTVPGVLFSKRNATVPTYLWIDDQRTCAPGLSLPVEPCVQTPALQGCPPANGSLGCAFAAPSLGAFGQELVAATVTDDGLTAQIGTEGVQLTVPVLANSLRRETGYCRPEAGVCDYSRRYDLGRVVTDRMESFAAKQYVFEAAEPDLEGNISISGSFPISTNWRNKASVVEGCQTILPIEDAINDAYTAVGLTLVVRVKYEFESDQRFFEYYFMGGVAASQTVGLVSVGPSGPILDANQVGFDVSNLTYSNTYPAGEVGESLSFLVSINSALPLPADRGRAVVGVYAATRDRALPRSYRVRYYALQDGTLPFAMCEDLADYDFLLDANMDGVLDNVDKELYRLYAIEQEAPCVADVTRDGIIDGDDYIKFFNDFSASERDADLDLDGSFDGSDVVLFVNSFSAGC